MPSFSGAAKGAATGAAVGSVVPGIGTVAGGLVGGAMGLFGGGGDDQPAQADPAYQWGPNSPGYYGYGTPDIQWGGGRADEFANYGLSRAGQGQNYQKGFLGEAQRARGPQAIENQDLSNRESYSRGYDQAGALQLAREAAMGQAPSAAGYQLQTGLDRALANQSAIQGGARGNAGIALAGANSAAASGNLMSTAYNDAAQLRAQEMANARGLYGGLSGQVRDQDLQRLQVGNDMSKFNAGLNDQYRLGMAGVGAQYGNQGLGWFQAAQSPYNSQMQGQLGASQIGANTYDAAHGRVANMQQGAYNRAEEERNANLRLVGTGITTAGQIAGAAAGK